MSDLYQPFTPAQRLVLLERLDRPEIATVADLEALRHAVRHDPSAALVKLSALNTILEEDSDDATRLFERILPTMLDAAWGLLASGIPSLPQLPQGRPGTVSLPRAVMPGWVAHILLGTLLPPSKYHPHVDAAPLWHQREPSSLAKLRCMLDLFDATSTSALPGRFTIERHGVRLRTSDHWAIDASPLTAVTVDTTGTIEDADLHLQVDFANKYLGGGVLTGGCVQEEIRFSVAPECLVGMLIAPVMTAEEALVLHGTERFANTAGYGYSLAYAGRLEDQSPRLPDGTPDVTLVAIDAVDYRRTSTETQFTEAALLREIEKARAGFRRDDRMLPVATGNWGAGAFRGDAALKAVLQWMAASTCGRSMKYFTFGDARVAGFGPFVTAARGRFATVGALWRRLLLVLKEDDGSEASLFRRLLAPH